jgi:hypothetical protein
VGTLYLKIRQLVLCRQSIVGHPYAFGPEWSKSSNCLRNSKILSGPLAPFSKLAHPPARRGLSCGGPRRLKQTFAQRAQSTSRTSGVRHYRRVPAQRRIFLLKKIFEHENTKFLFISIYYIYYYLSSNPSKTIWGAPSGPVAVFALFLYFLSVFWRIPSPQTVAYMKREDGPTLDEVPGAPTKRARSTEESSEPEPEHLPKSAPQAGDVRDNRAVPAEASPREEGSAEAGEPSEAFWYNPKDAAFRRVLGFPTQPSQGYLGPDAPHDSGAGAVSERRGQASTAEHASGSPSQPVVREGGGNAYRR